MNLLHVVDTIDAKKGGVSEAVNTMAIEIAKYGIQNEVVTSDLPENSLFPNAYKVHSLGPSKSAWSYNEKLVPWLKINLHRFDAIIVHGLWLYQGFGVTKALRRYKKNIGCTSSNASSPKLFIMPHGMLDPYFQLSKTRKLKAIRNWFYWKLIEGRIINNADGLLFTCSEENRLANVSFTPYQPKKRLIVGLGITSPPTYMVNMREAFYSKCRGLNNDAYILFLSRIDPKKGLQVLLIAYEKIILDSFSKNSPKIPKLVIAGPGLESPHGREIQKKVYNSPILQNSVIFPGMLEGDSKWGAFYGCDVFVLASHQENFGIAVVEALACAKTVIISNQINISQEIKNAEAGFIADDTVDGTYKSLQLWLELSDSNKKLMNLQARKCFENDFAIEPAANRLIKAIKENL